MLGDVAGDRLLQRDVQHRFFQRTVKRKGKREKRRRYQWGLDDVKCVLEGERGCSRVFEYVSVLMYVTGC